ncbi:MAG: glycosyltransferase family 4 protein [Phycisphaerales bacterium]
MPNRLRITFVLPTLDLSGGVRVISMLARELDAMGHDVLVVAGPQFRPPVRDRLRAAVKGDKHRWWSDPGRHHFTDLDIPIRRLDSARPVRDADLPEADAVIATWWATAEAVAELDASRGTKCYYAQHHEIHMDGQPHDRVNATYRLPLHLFACSGWVREQIEPIAGRPVPVVGYGMDRDIFDAPPREKQGRPTVGFMYSDVAFKGTETTLAAIRLARANLPDLRVRSFGSHPERPHLPLPAGCEHEIAPPQRRIAEIYASCDAWLVGSHAEGYGLPMLEAMACRTPLISTRTGAATDLIRDGANGFVVPVRDHEAMADRIARVCTRDRDRWRAMSDAAHATAESLTWRASAQAFVDQVERARSEQAASVSGER